MCLEVGRATNPRLVACFSTLYLFCKVKPSLLMTHCITIQPYLDIKCTVSKCYHNAPLVVVDLLYAFWLPNLGLKYVPCVVASLMY
jgi:hypothetical protein